VLVGACGGQVRAPHRSPRLLQPVRHPNSLPSVPHHHDTGPDELGGSQLSAGQYSGRKTYFLNLSALHVPHTYKRMLWIALIAIAALVLVFWDQPTGKVIIGITLCVLAVLVIIEFLGRPPSPAAAETAELQTVGQSILDRGVAGSCVGKADPCPRRQRSDDTSAPARAASASAAASATGAGRSSPGLTARPMATARASSDIMPLADMAPVSDRLDGRPDQLSQFIVLRLLS
jgi:hypothetical protein